ncbi:MAG: DUF1553 domain-containing protein [Planctomycetota bacterium]|nr:MAG: DUF1553 domain-containing protein [Planctomycetota bacterium]REK27703.1 MAG: DUF1553 domain-containing protein [Planctomycetota bacterium]REK38455.1 MAG: DUF1553 domain-containing protein [Planctomycetota bacterium]
MFARRLLTAIVAFSLLAGAASLQAAETFFEQQVAPVFAAKCLNCHNDEDREGGLSLQSATAVLAGGDSGEVIEPHDADSSYLIDLITAHNGQADMPQGDKPLEPAQVAAVRQWIDAGAQWPEGLTLEEPVWWSLKQLARPPLPESVSDPAAHQWIRNAVDAFVLAKLREADLQPSPEADKATLLRRLYFDLTGLPPTPAEVDAFVADDDPEAYEKLVDRLLASPRYGERWARHWLDVVHYGETHGYDKDKPRPHAWPYRDYVIRWLNEDKRYDRFIQEQIAGDILFPGTVDGIEALGFIAAGPWDHIGHAEIPESKIDGKIARHLDRDDMVQNTVMSFMSLTVGCAQCHDHKFDPITQKDYYSLHAVFSALDRADRKYDDDPAITAERDALYERGWALKTKIDSHKREKMRLEKAVAAEKDTAKDSEKAGPAKEGDEDQRDQGAAPSGNEVEVSVQLAEVSDKLTADEQALAEIRKQIAAMPEPKLAYIGMIHHGYGTFVGTGWGGGRPRPIHVLERGSILAPGEKVGPRALDCLEGLSGALDVPEEAPEGQRRVALAHWLSSRENSLTWRSIVNRVWQYHFGRGIVDTPNDFGRMGGTPSHPELLDYLAVEFRDGRQSLKDLHRLICNSATYRQASRTPAALEAKAHAIDADNRLLWRVNRRQLEAEAVRDSILFVSGKLDLKMGGPSFQDFVIDKPEHSPHYEYRLHDPEDPKSHRRSIYRFVVRSQTQPFMTVLDCADPSMMVAKRNTTISPLQSLALLNNKLSVVMARHFAARVEATDGTLNEQVERAFRLALGRKPAAEELAALQGYAERHGLANACRVLMNLNEFVFVD